MFVKRMSTRVRYGETDQMGYVYYGNYAQYFEIGRVETLRSLDISYRSMEEEGIMLPVLHLEVKYLAPALYDDLLEIETAIPVLPSSRIKFEHRIFNSDEKLITEGRVELAFVDKKTGRPKRAPNYILEALNPYFK